MEIQSVSRQTLQRLPRYLSYLKSLPDSGSKCISATIIAEALHLNHVVVRKDLAAVSGSGRPKIGYVRLELIRELEAFLGYDNLEDAVLVGAGRMGKALLSYDGFQQYGLNIAAAFDSDPALAYTEAEGKKILPMEKLGDLCRRLGIHMGIITVPGSNAQAVCSLLVDSGVLAIWNFSNVHLDVPEGVLVQNENLAVSLALLSNHLKERFPTK
ncbi:redox-sensing transcriptional repressor Rex [Neglectibacter caecimuris]|uniref:redox-sensing transcriptional repressor Rex n=1 Tax=Neglectibacter caecimuris TaxID=3093658 RepID=UPI002AC8A07C|nr:redox-sensing transcriptional repressor Rex [Neglectibacter sp. M00184]